MITCPTSGEAVWTGVTTSEALFSALATMVFTLQCPVCRLSHHWSGEDAWLEEDH
ncbi:MAG TPA: hypothetical protein VGG41_20205 [Solirubrobacteraceae bacterium]|jgi:hypothetical protein